MKRNVAILYGGRSGEHEISIRSARSILAAIDREKYDVSEYFISPEGKWNPRPILPEPGANPGIDVVFPVLHGTYGEDGTVQGLLELAELPYVGAGVLASSASMDKEVMKRLCREQGLPVVEYRLVYAGESIPCPLGFPFPVFVKPANLGSSVGISKARDCGELKAAVELASKYDCKIVIERGIDGREFECAVLGNEDPIAAAPCEILPSREFYDYEDKYELNLARTSITDAGLTRLTSLTDLHELDLSQTKITDAGLTRLSELKKLRQLRLGSTHVTPQGIAKLRKSLPRLKVSR